MFVYVHINILPSSVTERAWSNDTPEPVSTHSGSRSWCLNITLYYKELGLSVELAGSRERAGPGKYKINMEHLDQKVKKCSKYKGELSKVTEASLKGAPAGQSQDHSNHKV